MHRGRREAEGGGGGVQRGTRKLGGNGNVHYLDYCGFTGVCIYVRTTHIAFFRHLRLTVPGYTSVQLHMLVKESVEFIFVPSV